MNSDRSQAPPQDAIRTAFQLHQAGNLAEAEAIYRRVLEKEPDNAGAWHLLGVVALQLGRICDATELLEKAVRLKDTDPVPLNNLGNAYAWQGRLAQAEQCFRRALGFKPDYLDAHLNLGNTLSEAGQLEEAEQSYRQAQALAPDDTRIHINLGALLRTQRRLVESEQCYRRALQLSPASAEAHYALGNTLRDLGQQEQAVQSYRQALAIKPDYSEALQNLIMSLDFIERSDTAEQQQERRRWYAQYGKRYRDSIRPHRNIVDPDRRLRVGYVSADFLGHSASYIFGPVIRLHDRSAYEVICYSGAVREDDVTRRLRKEADSWRSTLGVSDEDLADRIRSDQIDILVDLSSHTAGHRLLVFARKPAPVQVTAWGYATGTGVETMDYFFADPVLVPEEERRYFAEEVIDLPCCVCYEAPPYAPQVSALPVLAGNPFTFGCVNRIEKISERSLGHWARILAAVPGSRLLLKEQKLDDPGIRARLLARLQSHGIAADRVSVLGKSSHAEHLGTYHQVDLALDPFPHGGGVSSMEALWMGVPVVTLLGSTIASRLSASILTRLDMHDWIACSDDEYVLKAAGRAADLPRLARIREGLRPRLAGSAVGDVRGYTRSVEATYRSLWRRWCESTASARDA